MEYFEKGKTYTFEEIQEIYKYASAVALKNNIEGLNVGDKKDPLFDAMISMIIMQTLASLNNIMFSERKNKESEE